MFKYCGKYGFHHNYCNDFFDLQKATSFRKNRAKADFVMNCCQFLEEEMELNGGTAFAVAESLYARMNDSGLHYHTPVHILSMLQFAEANSIALESWEKLAIWFHDAIFNATAISERNETQSAAFMRAILPNGHDATNVKVNMAELAILQTARHEDKDIKDTYDMVLDLDLCSLCFEPPAFVIATESIRREFTTFLTDDAFYAGRKNFFKRLMKKGFIYRTAIMRRNYETLAKKNIMSYDQTLDC